ncbi:hypothetical protein JM18_002493 [Phytophthora kernoviae]|uniref:RGS domain-containing protein n=1 Tax=Phytophthora kernoviae TaxID=325452 RepID=A0A922ARA4_9STRA|nr:hypothetical protein JM18_002493 [Phytophthora kernoviae]
MANSTSPTTSSTTQQEFTKLHEQLKQGADNAAGYLDSLKTKFTDYDNSHKSSGETITSYFQAGMDRANSSVDHLKKVAEDFRADANSKSDSFVSSAKSSMDQARSALDDLGKSAQAYDENLRSSINSNVANAKENSSSTLTSWQDSITSLVNTTRETTFSGFEALQNQIGAAQKAFAEQASIAQSAASDTAEGAAKKASDVAEATKPAETKKTESEDGPTLMERATGIVSSSLGYVSGVFQGSDAENSTSTGKTTAILRHQQKQMADLQSKMNAHQEDIDRAKAQIHESTQKADIYLTGLTKRVEDYEKKNANFEPAGQYLKSALDAARSATQSLKTHGQDLSERSVPVAVDGMHSVREAFDDLQKQAIVYDEKYADSRGQHAVSSIHEMVNSGRQHATEALEMANDQLIKLRDTIANMADQASYGAKVAVGEAVRVAEKGDEKLGVSDKAGGVVQKVRDLDARLGVTATVAKVDTKVTGGIGCKMAATTVDIVTESVNYISETLQNAKMAAQQSGTAQSVEAKAASATSATAQKKDEVVETFVEVYDEGEEKVGEGKEMVEEKAGDTKEAVKNKTGSTKEAAEQAAGAAKDKAGSMKEYAEGKAGEMKDQAQQTAADSKGKSQGIINQAASKASDVKDKAGEQLSGLKERATDVGASLKTEAMKMKEPTSTQGETNLGIQQTQAKLSEAAKAALGSARSEGEGMHSKKGGNEIQTLVKVLEKGQKDKRDIVIDDIISNPISCGYLLDFCQKGFKDECGLLDFRDPESVQSCKEMADQIWADFLSLNSPNEVSLPSDDREQTKERMKRPGEFRAKLFDVAMQDAIKTLQKDTLMRFLKAPQYTEMADKVTAVHEMIVKKQLDSDSSYQIEMPTVTTLTDEKIAKGNFSLDDILGDKILFREMLDYLEKKFKAENLKCARQIWRFEEMALEMKADDLKNFAWNLYLYFIAPSSPFEVSCTNLDRKSVQLRLGCPNKTMFEPIKENTMLVLKQDHKAFLQQLQSKTLKDRLKAEKAGNSPEKKGFLSKIKLF